MFSTEQSYNPNLELKIFGTAELGTVKHVPKGSDRLT